MGCSASKTPAQSVAASREATAALDDGRTSGDLQTGKKTSISPPPSVQVDKTQTSRLPPNHAHATSSIAENKDSSQAGGNTEMQTILRQCRPENTIQDNEPQPSSSQNACRQDLNDFCGSVDSDWRQTRDLVLGSTANVSASVPGMPRVLDIPAIRTNTTAPTSMATTNPNDAAPMQYNGDGELLSPTVSLGLAVGCTATVAAHPRSSQASLRNHGEGSSVGNDPSMPSGTSASALTSLITFNYAMLPVHRPSVATIDSHPDEMTEESFSAVGPLVTQTTAAHRDAPLACI